MDVLIGVIVTCVILMEFFMISALMSERAKNRAFAKLAEADLKRREDGVEPDEEDKELGDAAVEVGATLV